MRNVLVVTLVVATLVGDTLAAHGAPAPPDAGGSLVQAGIAAYRAGAPLHALDAFSNAASRAPRAALPALWAGVAAVAAGKPDQAARWFQAVLTRPHSLDEARVAEVWLARLRAARVAAHTGSPAVAERVAALAHAANPRLTIGQARWVGQAVVAAASREGVDPWLLASVLYIESRFNHQSVSGAGAMGIGQLMPQTAAAAGVDPRDPWQNILGAAEILRWNYLEFRDWALAIAAYNAGTQAVRRYGGVPPYAETRWYTDAVLNVYRQLKAWA